MRAMQENDRTSWIGISHENKMPRYYFVNNSILIVGDMNQARDITYNLLLMKGDPKSDNSARNGK